MSPFTRPLHSFITFQWRATLALNVLCLALLSGCKTLPYTQEEKLQARTDDDTLISEPAWLPECDREASQQADYSGPDYADIWSRIRAGYQLKDYDHPKVERFLNYYTRHPNFMRRVTKRGEPFLYHITQQLEQRSMPLEIALLPIVESAFDPFAYSHGRAAGMWQFIPGTARHFGLKQTWWYDGRRDALAATDAALRYLSELHQRLGGDWLLALAAYNSGEGNVRKAIRKNKKLGKPTDFWSLDLPRETRSYVPQLLAISRIVLTPSDYKIALTPVANRPYFATVDVGEQIDLAHAAELAGIDMKEMYRLNAGFNRWATDPEGPHRLLIPADKAEVLQQKLASADTPNVRWERYQVQSGDSLITIAKKFHTTPDNLRKTNNIRGNLIRAGQHLLIASASRPDSDYIDSVSQRLQRKQNKSNKDLERLEHTVKPGDSFWKIARQHGVSTKSLARWNGMAPGDTLNINQTLVIWKKAPVDSKIGRSDAVLRKVNYQVRSGDSLARIAQKFNLRINDILRWNDLDKKRYLQPGQKLTLYVDVTRS